MNLNYYTKPMKQLGGYITIKEFANKMDVSIQAVHKGLKIRKKHGRRINNFLRVGDIYLIHKSEMAKFRKKKTRGSV